MCNKDSNIIGWKVKRDEWERKKCIVFIICTRWNIRLLQLCNAWFFLFFFFVFDIFSWWIFEFLWFAKNLFVIYSKKKIKEDIFGTVQHFLFPFFFFWFFLSYILIVIDLIIYHIYFVIIIAHVFCFFLFFNDAVSLYRSANCVWMLVLFVIIFCNKSSAIIP